MPAGSVVDRDFRGVAGCWAGRGRAVADGDRRLTKGWEAEYASFRRRDLATGHVYVWATGSLQHPARGRSVVHLVIIGARPDGTQGGDRGGGWVAGERRELADGAARPESTGAAGPVRGGQRRALGFWAAARDVWPETAEHAARSTGSPTSWTSCRRGAAEGEAGVRTTTSFTLCPSLLIVRSATSALGRSTLTLDWRPSSTTRASGGGICSIGLPPPVARARRKTWIRRWTPALPAGWVITL